MSSYQYYEFVTVDRRLTRSEIEALEAISTRAKITPTRFANVYHYGDLKADPTALLAKYFDARVYVSNYGVREFAVRVPKTTLPVSATNAYKGCEGIEVQRTGAHAIVTFRSENEEHGGWIEDAWAEGLMSDLLPLRARLVAGDLSPLYVAWLAAMRTLLDEDDELDDDRLEPPVPPALRATAADIEMFSDFFDAGSELLAAAAEGVAQTAPREVTARSVGRWLSTQSEAKQRSWLTRVALGAGAEVEAEMKAALHKTDAPPARAARRRFSEIVARAQQIAAAPRARSRRR